MEGDRQDRTQRAAKAGQRAVKRQFVDSRMADETWTAAYEQVWPPRQQKFPALAGMDPEPVLPARCSLPLAKGA